MVQVNPNRGTGVGNNPPPFSVNVIQETVEQTDKKTKEVFTRTLALHFAQVLIKPNLKNPAEYQAFKNFIAGKLAYTGISEEQLDRALAPDGVIAKVLDAGIGRVTVVDIITARSKDAPPAAPTPAPAPRILHAVKTGPAPSAPVQKTTGLMVAPKSFATVAQARQWQCYEKAKTFVDAKIARLQARSVGGPTPIVLAKLFALSKNLDLAAQLLQKGNVPAPEMANDKKSDAAANALYSVAYVFALASNKNAPLSDYDIRHAGGETQARAGLAETAAYKIFDLTPGDPLSPVSFRSPDAVAEVLRSH